MNRRFQLALVLTAVIGAACAACTSANGSAGSRTGGVTTTGGAVSAGGMNATGGVFGLGGTVGSTGGAGAGGKSGPIGGSERQGGTAAATGGMVGSGGSRAGSDGGLDGADVGIADAQSASGDTGSGIGGAAGSGKLTLWYRKAATNWMTSALPIGNGRLGGMIFGDVAQEHIQFNEKTLWSGNTKTRGTFQSFGDLYFDFSGAAAPSNYRRELSLEEAIARVSYTVGGATYKREYFSSFPDDVMVMRLTGDGSAKVSFSVRLADSRTGGKTSISGNRISFTGKLTLLSYEAQVLVQADGGTVTAASDRITVANANAATILLAAATDYSPTETTYVTGTGAAGVHSTVTGQIDAASAKSYDTLKSAHVNDYQALFNRVALHLDETTPTVPTDELQKSYNGGIYNPFLDVLYYQYGRYLLISSSRGMPLPANLQGLWNDSNDPPWQSDYHSDINVQMNYWPAELTNLPECHQVFLDYIYNEATNHPSWKALASADGNAGWTVMVQNNIFGYGDWKYTRPANAWYSMHLWQHYNYSQDKDFLSTKAYPVMKGACDFWMSRLKTDADGMLVAPGEWSPEQTPDSEDGVTYAQTLIWDLFTNTIKANLVLNEDATYRTKLQSTLDKLDKGLRVGSWGQLREWKHTNDDRANTHRHLSHLIGLFPGKQISPLIDTIYSNAAKVSLTARGDVGPGWSRAWKIAVWARLFDGNHSHLLIKNALQNATVTVVDMSNGGGAYENLLDAHPPFQIDGNFGATAGMTEMLLQSQLDKLILLPALPDAWPKGSITGIGAQGGFEVAMAWNQKRLMAATIKSKTGNSCTVKNAALTGTFSVVNMADNSEVLYARSGDSITFNTSAAAVYKISVP